jgi:hypothetical protein
VGEDVVDFPGDPRPLGQGGGLVLGRVRPPRLLQGLLRLLGPEQVSAAGQAERPQADERGRVAGQGFGRRPDREARDPRSQTIQATVVTARATLIAMLRGPASPGCGDASGTVASMTTSTMIRTAAIAGGVAEPPGDAPRMVSQRSVIRLSTSHS